uniref:Uncharacterized protein n=1 Tax=Streptomyces sp. NBC_01393 TaxID=2903851 RepID=A0AAU3IC52_9ACTN
MDERRLVVLAGNYREFTYWCHENGRNPRDRNLIYASEISRIRGLGPIRYITYGTWYMRRDSLEMHTYLIHLERRYPCPEQKPDGTPSATPSQET